MKKLVVNNDTATVEISEVCSVPDYDNSKIFALDRGGGLHVIFRKEWKTGAFAALCNDKASVGNNYNFGRTGETLEVYLESLIKLGNTVYVFDTWVDYCKAVVERSEENEN